MNLRMKTFYFILKFNTFLSQCGYLTDQPLRDIISSFVSSLSPIVSCHAETLPLHLNKDKEEEEKEEGK